MVNPYSCYAIAFLVALVAYPLGWSELYPPLTLGLTIFLLTTVAVHLFASFRFAGKHGSVYKNVAARQPETAALWVTIFIYLLWFAEFIYEGGMPLMKILWGHPYNYRLFGIPSLHVFAVTFSSFYTVYLFHLYLSSRSRILLALFLLNLLAAILIYSRAMFFFNASACLFMFVATRKRIPSAVPYVAAIGLVVLLYLFGVMGTLRVSREFGMPYDNRLFLETGKASASFVESAVPKEYFWTYIYLTSPLANLQNNINQYPAQPASFRRAAEMVNNEVLFDFVSKRTNAMFEVERANEITIPGPFNVSTVYSRCFSYLGWIGMLLMAVFILLIPEAYMKLVPKESPFFMTGFVTLCTIFLFLAYDNTIRLTGLSFQLVYPAILHFGCKWLPVFRKIFL